MTEEITEAAIDRAVAGAFGRPVEAVDPRVATALREAGFDDDQVQRGLEMWESGRYLGFEDVATSLTTSGWSSFGPDNRPLAARVSTVSIAEAGQRLAAVMGEQVAE